MTVRNWVQDVATEGAYAIGKVLFAVQHDPAEEASFFRDPAAYLDHTSLDAAARKAVIECDVATLYSLGVNPYLVRAYCLQLRMPEAEYIAALRSVKGLVHG
jgi:protocatechuate 4,5-dioxygenase alpha chain